MKDLDKMYSELFEKIPILALIPLQYVTFEMLLVALKDDYSNGISCLKKLLFEDKDCCREVLEKDFGFRTFISKEALSTDEVNSLLGIENGKIMNEKMAKYIPYYMLDRNFSLRLVQEGHFYSVEKEDFAYSNLLPEDFIELFFNGYISLSSIPDKVLDSYDGDLFFENESNHLDEKNMSR